MTQIVRDTSAYYLLGYNSTQAPSDGKFHEIKVRVKRPGVQVRARRGYWALTADGRRARAGAQGRACRRPWTTRSLRSACRPAAHNTIRTWIGTSRGANGKTRVTLVWEPMPRVAGDRDARSEAPARVMVTAVGPDGAPYFRGRVPRRRPRRMRRQRLAARDVRGRTRARCSCACRSKAAASQVLDTETREIAVPDLTAAEIDSRNAAVAARAGRRATFSRSRAIPTPVPVAAREFSRADRLLVRVPAYGPGNTAPTLGAQLLNRGGQPMSELPIEPSGAPDTQQIELPLAALAPGEYLLEIKAGDLRELVGFRVTP